MEEEKKDLAWNLTEKEVKEKEKELTANPNHNCGEHPSVWLNGGWYCPYKEKVQGCSIKYKGAIGEGHPNPCCPAYPHIND